MGNVPSDLLKWNIAQVEHVIIKKFTDRLDLTKSFTKVLSYGAFESCGKDGIYELNMHKLIY